MQNNGHYFTNVLQTDTRLQSCQSGQQTIVQFIVVKFTSISKSKE